MEYVIALFLGALGSLLAAELYANAARLSSFLISKAALRLPEAKRDRYREEWHAHLDDCAGNLGKLWHALNCYLFAATGVAKTFITPTRSRTDGNSSSSARHTRGIFDEYRIKSASWLWKRSNYRRTNFERTILIVSRAMLDARSLTVQLDKVIYAIDAFAKDAFSKLIGKFGRRQ